MTTLSGTNLHEQSIDRDAAADVGAFDATVVFIIGTLMTIGVVMVYSASATIDGEPLDLRQWWKTPLRQCVFAIGGFVAMLFAARLDHRLWAWERRGAGWWAGSLYVLALLMLLVVLMPGIGASRFGAQRAIVLMTSPIPLSFQPAELAKVALVVWLAALLTRPGFDIKSLRAGYAPAFLSAGLLVALIGLEDYGTAALLGVIVLAMLLVSGARWLHLIGTGLLGLAAGAGLLWWKPYRLERIWAFFADDPDPTREGYQILQSLIAIGSGGWWGRGLGAGVQKYGYLPQDNNDFIFAIVCEELGIIGGMVVVGLFLLLLLRGWRISRQALTPFGRLLAVGFTLTICLQAAFNIAVVTDSVPTKGISLPFVSAGGSGVLFLGVAGGLLASVGGRTVRRLE